MGDHALYALAWAFFALGHSGLASPAAKRVLKPLLGHRLRLAYNLVALLQFALVAWVGAVTLGGRPAFDLPARWEWALAPVHLAGWAVLLWSARHYDLGLLAGTRQLREPRFGEEGADEDGPLRLEGPHRYVRHPLYAGGFLILWGAAASPLGLATAVWGSLYLLMGTWFEERKLLRLHGRAYAEYRRRVPAFVPWKGRCI